MIHFCEKKLELNRGKVLADFELDAFANLMIETELDESAELEIAIGEVLSSDGASIECSPGGFRTFRVMKKFLPAGKSSFAFDIPRHQSPYWHTVTIRTPLEAGSEVIPFRYVELNGGSGSVKLIRKALYGKFDDSASEFISDNTELNCIWEFCKYSMKATGGFGIYIDGERERKPYEGDAFINQLGDLCCGGSWETAFATLRWLLNYPTYPTEWQLLAPFLVRDFLLYTGQEKLVAEMLGLLKSNFEKLLHQLSPEGFLTDGYPAGNSRCCGGLGQRLDIVDWPVADRDGYEFGEVNLVPNCYLYGALQVMNQLTGNEKYLLHAEKLRQVLISRMYRGESGLFVDNPQSEHTSLHSAFFPVYFGVTAGMNIEKIKDFIRSKKMLCSVFGAHFLLETAFDNGLSDHAFDLLLSHDLQSYHNMLKCGATIAMEAWDDSLKPNQDWNHAWGAAPANLIPRCIAGIKPLEPGFRKFSVFPHPGNLKKFFIKHPTPYGAIELEYKDGLYSLSVPEGTVAVTAAGEFSSGEHRFDLS